MSKAQHTPWPLNENINALGLPHSAYFDAIQHAKELDRIGMQHGQFDPCFHLCALQREHQRDGRYLHFEIDTNIFGFVVRDTMNDGLGVVFGGRADPNKSALECVEYALEWYAQDKEHRAVTYSLNYMEEVKREELEAALAKAKGE